MCYIKWFLATKPLNTWEIFRMTLPRLRFLLWFGPEERLLLPARDTSALRKPQWPSWASRASGKMLLWKTSSTPQGTFLCAARHRTRRRWERRTGDAPLHRCTGADPAATNFAPRRRSRAGADRGRLAPAKQLFGRSPTQVDLSKDWAIYCPQRLFQKCAAQKLTSASCDRLWSQRWPVKKRQPSLRSKCWKLRSEIQSNLNKRKNPIDFDEARQSIHGDDGEPSLFVFPYSPWHNLLPRNVRTFCFSIKIMYLHNISAFHSIVPGLHFRSLSLWSRFLYPPLYLIPREFDRISIQNQSGSLEMLLQPHYAFEGRVYGRDYCHVAPPSSWSIKYKNAWIQFLTYFWGK